MADKQTPDSDGGASKTTLPSGVERSTVATVEDLFRKPRPTRRMPIVLTDEGGEPVKMEVVFQAIPPERYDELMRAYPPSKADKARGFEYDPDKFSIALIAESLLQPKMTLEQVEQLQESGEWSRGELGGMFAKALEVNHAGLEVPFTRSG